MEILPFALQVEMSVPHFHQVLQKNFLINHLYRELINNKTSQYLFKTKSIIFSIAFMEAIIFLLLKTYKEHKKITPHTNIYK